jgi:hypothetical protein
MLLVNSLKKVLNMLLNKALKAAQGLRQIGYAILQVKEGGMVSEERGHGGTIIFVQHKKLNEPNYVTREELEEAIQRAMEQGAQNGARIVANSLKNSPSNRRRHGV